MSLLGFGSANSRIKNRPAELFFETDYHPLIRDRDGFVLDEQTGIAPHLINPGLYTNSNNEPHLDLISTSELSSQDSQRDLLGERIREMERERISHNESSDIPVELDENRLGSANKLDNLNKKK
jgi:hypothetical protein